MPRLERTGRPAQGRAGGALALALRLRELGLLAVLKRSADGSADRRRLHPEKRTLVLDRGVEDALDRRRWVEAITSDAAKATTAPPRKR